MRSCSLATEDWSSLCCST